MNKFNKRPRNKPTKSQCSGWKFTHLLLQNIKPDRGKQPHYPSLIVCRTVLIFVIIGVWNLSIYADSSVISKAETLLENGMFAETIKFVNANILASEDSNFLSSCHLINATSYQQLGKTKEQFISLNRAISYAKRTKEKVLQIQTHIRISDFYLTIGKHEKSKLIGTSALANAKESNNSYIISLAQNNLGNILFVENDFKGALIAYNQCVNLCRTENTLELELQAILNIAKTSMTLVNLSEAGQALENADIIVQRLSDTYQKAFHLVNIGHLAQRLFLASVKSSRERSIALDIALKSYTNAMNISTKLNNHRLSSLTNGHLGQLYMANQQIEDAIKLTRIAIFQASQSSNRDILYRWQWQLGQLYKTIGNNNDAIKFYENAVKTLNPIRNTLLVGGRNNKTVFVDSIKPVYYELASLYLTTADRLIEKEQQHHLKLALDTLELLKSAELEDYFQDDCVAAVQSRQKRLDLMTIDAAVLYPIILENRLVMLLVINNIITKYITEIDSETVKNEAKKFRMGLQKRSSRKFMYSAQKLYKWIIGPLENHLNENQVDTLVVVPDGVLRLIPFAALHDGKKYLIQKWAQATTPGLKLIGPKSISHDNLQVLGVGLSKGVQGYSELPNVPLELRSIDTILDGDFMLDEQYTSKSVYARLKRNPFGIVHFATHGEFNSDPKKSYLLTFNDKITMDKLESVIKVGQYRDSPIELLTLSACKTAVGNEKSALGLAGIAVKSGARSVLATLWYISDEATKMVISEFYKYLTTHPESSKAHALQHAQIEILNKRRFRHPAYWAPYLLIGNWL